MFVQNLSIGLERGVQLLLHEQEASNYSTDVSEVVPVVLLVESKFIFEELVLLIEYRDSCQGIPEYFEGPHDYAMVPLLQDIRGVVL